MARTVERGKVIITQPVIGEYIVAKGVREIRGRNDDVDPPQAVARILNASWRVTLQPDGTWKGNYLAGPINPTRDRHQIADAEAALARIEHRRDRRQLVSYRSKRARRYSALWRNRFMRMNPEYIAIDHNYGHSHVNDPRWFIPDSDNSETEKLRWIQAVEIAARTGMVMPVQHSYSAYKGRAVQATDPTGMVISETRPQLSIHVAMPAWGFGLNLTPYTEREARFYE